MSRGCIVCGRDNPVGLHIQFRRTPTGVEATVRPQAHFQGFSGVLHGGVVCGLLDDAMWWAIYAQREVITMTADISVRYKKPVPVGTDLRVEASVDAARNSRLFLASGRLRDAAGEVLAEAHGKFLAAPAGLAATLTRELASGARHAEEGSATPRSEG